MKIQDLSIEDKVFWSVCENTGATNKGYLRYFFILHSFDVKKVKILVDNSWYFGGRQYCNVIIADIELISSHWCTLLPPIFDIVTNIFTETLSTPIYTGITFPMKMGPSSQNIHSFMVIVMGRLCKTYLIFHVRFQKYFVKMSSHWISITPHQYHTHQTLSNFFIVI